MRVDARTVIRWSPVLLVAVAAGLFLVFQLAGSWRSVEPVRTGGKASDPYAGSESCRECHEDVNELWEGSHHALAEREFDPAKFHSAFHPPREVTHGSLQSSVRFRAGKYEVVTLGANGEVAAHHPVRVIGVDPLWQVLVAAPQGRYQVTALAHDPNQGDWFDVYGDEDRRPHEWGFWTGRGMTWNSMCASCHTTRLRKGYDTESDSYATTFLELGVGCEACHGPSKRHVEAMREREESGSYVVTEGSSPALTFERRTQVGTGASLQGPQYPEPDPLLDVCGPCHARRSELTEEFVPGDDFLDHYRPVIPDMSEIYYPDGQVREEDYEYVSFLSSRMYLEGVRCTHCHEPHTSKTWEKGNELCMICHKGKIDPAAHSFHDVEGPGGQCVDCHMPLTTYMQRHPRHDHGFTIPDPLLTREFGIPNACNRCHQEDDEDVDWAVRTVEEWYGERMERPTRRRARAIARAREHDEAVVGELIWYGRNDPSPLWRAAAVQLLGNWVITDERVRDVLVERLRARSALVRACAVRALEPVEPLVRGALTRLLDDPVRLVRVETAWVLRSGFDPKTRAGKELLEHLGQVADHAGGAVMVGVFHLQQDPPQIDRALWWIRRALEWDQNSAEIHRWEAIALSSAGQVEKAVSSLRRAARLAPSEPRYLYELALALNEAGHLGEAEDTLEQVCETEPEFSRAWYNLALARARLGQPQRAMDALESALRLEPANPDFLQARGSFLLQLGNEAEAERAFEQARRAAASGS